MGGSTAGAWAHDHDENIVPPLPDELLVLVLVLLASALEVLLSAYCAPAASVCCRALLAGGAGAAVDVCGAPPVLPVKASEAAFEPD